MYIVSHDRRRDGIFSALEDQRPGYQLWNVQTIVRQECDTGEVLCLNGIQSAEARFQLGGKDRVFGISHDDRGHHC